MLEFFFHNIEIVLSRVSYALVFDVRITHERGARDEANDFTALYAFQVQRILYLLKRSRNKIQTINNAPCTIDYGTELSFKNRESTDSCTM